MKHTQLNQKEHIFLKRAFLGGAASLIAGTVTHPVELIKIRF